VSPTAAIAFIELAFFVINLVVEILILVSLEKQAIEKVYLVANIRTVAIRFFIYF